MFLILLAYAVCATTFTICKAVLSYSQPIFFVGFRMALAGILLLGYVVLKKGARDILRFNRWRDVAAIIFFHIYIAYIADLWSLQYLSSADSAFVYNLSPFLTAFFSFILLGERLSVQKWIGLLIGFGALAAELLSCSGATCSMPLLPTAVLIGGVASAMYGWTVMRKLIVEQGLSIVVINGVGMLGGGVLALLTSLLYETWDPIPVLEWAPFLKLTLLIILVANVIFYNLYGYLLSQYSATMLSFAGFVTPFFAALFGVLFLGEQLSLRFCITMVFVAFGLYIFYRDELFSSKERVA